MLLILMLLIVTPAKADYMIVIEGWNKDFIAFKLAQWHKNGVKVRLVTLPGVGKTLWFKGKKVK